MLFRPVLINQNVLIVDSLQANLQFELRMRTVLGD